MAIQPTDLVGVVPAPYAAWVCGLLNMQPVHLGLGLARHPKLGFYQSPAKAGGHHTIALADLPNQFTATLTLLHELAHLHAFKQFGYRIKPHGPEWQRAFSPMLIEFARHPATPRELGLAVAHHAQSPRATFGADMALVRALSIYDPNDGLMRLEGLGVGTHFTSGKRKYWLLARRRKRHIAMALPSQRIVALHGVARVKPMSHQDIPADVLKRIAPFVGQD